MQTEGAKTFSLHKFRPPPSILSFRFRLGEKDMNYGFSYRAKLFFSFHNVVATTIRCYRTFPSQSFARIFNKWCQNWISEREKNFSVCLLSPSLIVKNCIKSHTFAVMRKAAKNLKKKFPWYLKHSLCRMMNF